MVHYFNLPLCLLCHVWHTRVEKKFKQLEFSNQLSIYPTRSTVNFG